MQALQLLHDAVFTGDANTAKTATQQALAAGFEPMSLVQDYMVPAMDKVGQRFEAGEYFVPELLISARAMKAALELIRPALPAGGAHYIGHVVLGTVQGDLHDIGKNLVGAMLEGGGYDVIDLGVNVRPEQFAQAAIDHKANVVAMSALLTTTMPAMKSTIDALEKAGVRERVKILIGGAPVSQRFADEIGADGYSDTAVGAVTLAKRLLR